MGRGILGGRADANYAPRLSVTVADEGGNSGLATIQVQTASGVAIAGYFVIRTWIALAAYSEADPVATAYTPATGELLSTVEAKGDIFVITDSAGKVTITITDDGPGTVHVMAELNGRVYTGSAALTT